MEKKVLNIIIAVVVAVIVVAATSVVVYEHQLSTQKKTAAPTVSVSASTELASTGSAITFRSITTGTVTAVTWNFGDGSIANGTTVTHNYSSPGIYLVLVNATGPGGYGNNLASMFLVTISAAATTNSTYLSEATQPVLILNKTSNAKAPIYSISENAALEASYLQPPSATDWSLGYYILSFGSGTSTVAPVYYDTSSGTYETGSFTHAFATQGLYPATLSIITYNQSSFTSDLATNSSTGFQYLPVTYLPQVLSSEYLNTSYVRTVYAAGAAQAAGILTGPSNVPNPGTITVAEVTHSPYTLDPCIDYDWPGLEIFGNIYETLIANNGSNTGSFVPIVATKVPTIANGGISPDGLNYTFTVRSGLKFSNGDSLTAWDVYTSMVRTLLLMQGSPGTPGWILAQDLLPGGGYDTGAVSYQNITSAITVDNNTQTVAFHLLNPDNAFLDYLAYQTGASIMDYNWLVQHGAGITFTPQGFADYMNFANEATYNQYLEYNTMGSGPYELETYLTGQSITLVPNPNFVPIPGVFGYSAAPNASVYIEYLKDPATALLMMSSFQADITVGLPPSDYPTASTLQSQGKINIYSFPTMSINFYLFNWNVNTTLMQSTFGSQYNVPAHYFANSLVRQAFSFVFNHTTFINSILGNKVYGGNFGFNYTGIIPPGIPGYVPPDQLYNVPSYNLQQAKQYMMDSGSYNTTVNIPVAVYAGDPMDYAATSMWAADINAMDPNIHITPVYVTGSTILGYLVPGGNPMPLFNVQGSWSPDFPYPPDYLNNMYLSSGFYANGLGFGASNLQNWGFSQEASEYQNMTDLINAGNSAINQTVQFKDWTLAERLAVNLSLYVYTYVSNSIFYYASWMHGAQYESNPMYCGANDELFFYLSKG